MSTTAAVAGKIQPRLKQKYNSEIKKALQEEFGVSPDRTFGTGDAVVVDNRGAARSTTEHLLSLVLLLQARLDLASRRGSGGAHQRSLPDFFA